jgi:hypothetical protein
MDTSTPAEPSLPREPSEVIVDTIAAQTAAIDELIGLAQLRLQIFDIDLSQCGWNTVTRADNLRAFLRRLPASRIDLIVHDPRYLESACPRLQRLLQNHAHAITVYKTGPEARNAMDPLLIADGRHFLHRFHIDQPRASFAIEQPAMARPLVGRFEQIWATGEPGLSATVLGL